MCSESAVEMNASLLEGKASRIPRLGEFATNCSQRREPLDPLCLLRERPIPLARTLRFFPSRPGALLWSRGPLTSSADMRAGLPGGKSSSQMGLCT